MINSPFLVVRFAGGSAGRFVSTMFQLSDSVAHWNPAFDNQIEITAYTKYLTNCFPGHPKTHLRVEPDLPYYSDFYSGTYERGQKVTFEQYCQHQKLNGCDYFFKNQHSNKKINLILHKSVMPVFMQNSIVINIIIDTDRALELSKKMLWLKHYLVIDSHTVKQLAHDPMTCNKKRSHLVEKYNKNSSLVSVNSIKDFYNQEIECNSDFALFQNSDAIFADPSNGSSDQYIFYLDNIFDENRTIKNILDICNQTQVQPPAISMLSFTYQFWWAKQHEILSVNTFYCK